MAQALKPFKVCVLQPDAQARGMAGRLIEGVESIGYEGFVDLVVAHTNNQSWL
jgi:tRNA 2-thiouridine synthesizing protein B